MAKVYEFRFNAQRADFSIRGIVSVAYGTGATLAEEIKECTFAEALRYLPEFSAKAPGPHSAFLGMRYRNDRVPPGFKKANLRIDRKSGGAA